MLRLIYEYTIVSTQLKAIVLREPKDMQMGNDHQHIMQNANWYSGSTQISMLKNQAMANRQTCLKDLEVPPNFSLIDFLVSWKHSLG